VKELPKNFPTTIILELEDILYTLNRDSLKGKNNTLEYSNSLIKRTSNEFNVNYFLSHPKKNKTSYPYNNPIQLIKDFLNSKENTRIMIGFEEKEFDITEMINL